jgi:hypothetical protein
MLNHDNVNTRNELGMVICRVCNKVLYTLPTNGLKKIYGVCDKAECLGKSIEGEGELK